MTPLLAYFAKVIICSGILYGYYHLALRNNRFHQWNRYYLLLSTVLSLVVPLVRIPLSFTPAETQGIYVYTSQVVSLREQVFTPSEAGPFAGLNWTFRLYGGIIILGLLRLAFSYLKILRLVHRSHTEYIKPYWLVLSEHVAAPFSFFRYIFWNNRMNATTAEGQQMLQHEMVHVQEKHSMDKLFLEIVTALCWINPFFHLIKRELSLIHEFIADKKAVVNGNVGDYAQTILQMALQSTRPFSMTNNFSQHPVKRRILMLTQSRKLRFSYLRRLMILPIAALIFCSLAFVITEEKMEQLGNNIAMIHHAATQSDNDRSGSAAAPVAVKNDPGALVPVNNTSGGMTNARTQVSPPTPPRPVTTQETAAAAAPDTTPKKEVFTFVEQPPAFPGGNQALASYLSRNIRYPHEATEKGTKGTVFVSYIVTEDGSVTDVKTIGAKKGDGLEEEAMRVVKAMPKWIPGKQNGRYVSVQFNLPIRFTLTEVKKEETKGPKVGEDGIYVNADVLPRFPGGDGGLAKYLSTSIRYPAKAAKAGLQGNVIVSFVLDTEGNISDIEAVNKPLLGGGLEEEAIRVVKAMPKWRPAVDGDKSVPFRLALPVRFHLQ